MHLTSHLGGYFYTTCTVHVAQTRRYREQIKPSRSALYHGIPGNGWSLFPVFIFYFRTL